MAKLPEFEIGTRRGRAAKLTDASSVEAARVGRATQDIGARLGAFFNDKARNAAAQEGAAEGSANPSGVLQSLGGRPPKGVRETAAYKEAVDLTTSSLRTSLGKRIGEISLAVEQGGGNAAMFEKRAIDALEGNLQAAASEGLPQSALERLRDEGLRDISAKMLKQSRADGVRAAAKLNADVTQAIGLGVASVSDLHAAGADEAEIAKAETGLVRQVVGYGVSREEAKGRIAKRRDGELKAHVKAMQATIADGKKVKASDIARMHGLGSKQAQATAQVARAWNKLLLNPNAAEELRKLDEAGAGGVYTEKMKAGLAKHLVALESDPVKVIAGMNGEVSRVLSFSGVPGSMAWGDAASMEARRSQVARYSEQVGYDVPMFDQAEMTNLVSEWGGTKDPEKMQALVLGVNQLRSDEWQGLAKGLMQMPGGAEFVVSVGHARRNTPIGGDAGRGKILADSKTAKDVAKSIDPELLKFAPAFARNPSALNGLKDFLVHAYVGRQARGGDLDVADMIREATSYDGVHGGIVYLDDGWFSDTKPAIVPLHMTQDQFSELWQGGVDERYFETRPVLEPFSDNPEYFSADSLRTMTPVHIGGGKYNLMNSDGAIVSGFAGNEQGGAIVPAVIDLSGWRPE